ncbi:hypothetical protein INR99_08585 [Chitinilyticum litopenaei]|uniref:Class I SAM-dependent methyltransferase n=1 Tax=Chitinilyticum piscinae TaxID=2866724 RepID=A0A8J7FMR7_9NEIS|nr:hypothetical protein [Chitinilyticum piscinae]
MLAWQLLAPRLGDAVAALLGGLLAACASWLCTDAVWWRLIHLVFIPAIALLLRLELPPWIFLLGFSVLWLLSGPALQQRVPLYLSGNAAIRELARLLPADAHFLDLGAGSGRVLRQLHRLRPDLQLAGTEIALLPWLYGRLTLPAAICWMKSDYRSLSLSGYDCVYAFLSSEPMPELWLQVNQQMRQGSLFISNTFGIPGQTPEAEVDYGDWKSGRLLIWRIGKAAT